MWRWLGKNWRYKENFRNEPKNFVYSLINCHFSIIFFVFFENEWSDYCYKFFSDSHDRQPFPECRDVCEKDWGAHLLEVQSLEQSQIVRKWAEKKGDEADDYLGLWLGVSDIGKFQLPCLANGLFDDCTETFYEFSTELFRLIDDIYMTLNKKEKKTKLKKLLKRAFIE